MKAYLISLAVVVQVAQPAWDLLNGVNSGANKGARFYPRFFDNFGHREPLGYVTLFQIQRNVQNVMVTIYAT